MNVGLFVSIVTEVGKVDYWLDLMYSLNYKCPISLAELKCAVN